MKIAVFLDQSFPPDSRVENEISVLSEAGFEIELFSLNFKNLAPAFEIVNGIRVHRIPAGKLLYKLSALAYDLPLFHRMLRKKIHRFLSDVEPDVIHVHDMLIARPVMAINDRYFQLPLTLDLHENRPEIMRYYPHLQRFPTKQLINLERWAKAQNELIRKADHVVLVTEEAVDEAVKSTGALREKFLVIPNAIRPQLFLNYEDRPEIANKFPGGFKLVYVGDIGLRRGLDTTIEAMNLVKPDIPDISMIVVGTSSEMPVLEQMVKGYGLESQVHFEGWQDLSTFPSYIKAADLCISPLHRNKHHDTTLANKLFQYMACNRPLLVSDCPGQANVVNDIGCGLVFEAENANDMATAIKKLYAQPELCESMAEKGRTAVLSSHSWETLSAGLVTHYRELESKVRTNG